MINPNIELEHMGITDCKIQLMQEKAGIAVYQVTHKSCRSILKTFGNPADCREIKNYTILSSIGIPTLTILAHTDCALLMEDINASPYLRLGCENDLADTDVAIAVAQWYRQLHEKGKSVFHLLEYDECDAITLENMRYVMKMSKTEANPFWNLLFCSFTNLRAIIDSLPRTITYNDFYWSNLTLAKDKTTALMFDYNLLGKGYVYADIRNVTSSMTPASAEAFIEAYGEYDTAQKTADNVLRELYSLQLAFGRPSLPPWGFDALKKLKSGELEHNLAELFQKITR